MNLELLNYTLKFLVAENNIIFGGSTPGFLHLRTLGIWGQIIIC